MGERCEYGFLLRKRCGIGRKKGCVRRPLSWPEPRARVVLLPVVLAKRVRVHAAHGPRHGVFLACEPRIFGACIPRNAVGAPTHQYI